MPFFWEGEAVGKQKNVCYGNKRKGQLCKFNVSRLDVKEWENAEVKDKDNQTEVCQLKSWNRIWIRIDRYQIKEPKMQISHKFTELQGPAFNKWLYTISIEWKWNIGDLFKQKIKA